MPQDGVIRVEDLLRSPALQLRLIAGESGTPRRVAWAHVSELEDPTPWLFGAEIDFFFVRRGHYAILDIFNPNGIYGVWSYRGLIAYAAGFAAEIPFMVLLNVVTLKSYYTGPLANDLNSVDISWIVGAVVTAVVYWALTRNLNAAAEQTAVAESDAGLREIDSATSA